MNFPKWLRNRPPKPSTGVAATGRQKGIWKIDTIYNRETHVFLHDELAPDGKATTSDSPSFLLNYRRAAQAPPNRSIALPSRAISCGSLNGHLRMDFDSKKAGFGLYRVDFNTQALPCQAERIVSTGTVNRPATMIGKFKATRVSCSPLLRVGPPFSRGASPPVWLATVRSLSHPACWNSAFHVFPDLCDGRSFFDPPDNLVGHVAHVVHRLGQPRARLFSRGNERSLFEAGKLERSGASGSSPTLSVPTCCVSHPKRLARCHIFAWIASGPIRGPGR